LLFWARRKYFLGKNIYIKEKAFQIKKNGMLKWWIKAYTCVTVSV
jgi:hypothetical protein